MIVLPVLSPAASRSWRRLAPRLPLPFSLASADWVLALPDAAAEPAPGWLPFEARVGNTLLSLHVHPGLVPASIAGQVPELAALGVPDGLRNVLTDVLLGEVADALAPWCGDVPPMVSPALPPALPSASGDTLPAGRPHRLHVSRNGTAAAWLALDDAGLGWLAAQLSAFPARPVELSGLPARLDLLLDCAFLALHEIRAARPGDVVLLDAAPAPDADGTLAVLLPTPGAGPGFRARLAPGQAPRHTRGHTREQAAGARLTILSALDGQMDDTPPPLPGSLDDLRLPVEFLVGTLTLPLSRLRELAPGQVLDLGLDATSAVLLRVNGQVIAEGELVRIAERTGVRISELHLARN